MCFLSIKPEKVKTLRIFLFFFDALPNYQQKTQVKQGFSGQYFFYKKVYFI